MPTSLKKEKALVAGHDRANGESQQNINNISILQEKEKNINEIDQEKNSIQNYIDYDAIVKKIALSKYGANFLELFQNGDLSKFNGGLQQASFALCNTLAYWTYGDIVQINGIFKLSALYDLDPAIWDTNTAYRNMILIEAYEKYTEKYPNRKPPKKEPFPKVEVVATKDGYRPVGDQAKLDIICLDNVEVQCVKWLWYPFIPLGRITLMQGDPGQGKSYITMAIASIISNGGFFPEEPPFEENKREPGVVIYQTAEDGVADTIVPRLKKMNANLKNVFVVNEEEQGLTLSDSRIEEMMKQYNPKLIVFDPLQAYLGQDVDMHRANAVRPILANIARLADKYECAILFIMHMSKMTTTTAQYRALGSIDIPGAARSVLCMGCNPEDTDQKIIAHLKHNLTRRGDSLAFRITADGIQWEGISELEADDIVNVSKKRKEREASSLDDATDFLCEIMGENGYLKADEITRHSEERGIKKSTLYKAKKELSIKSHQIGRGKNHLSWWAMPDVKVPKPTQITL